MLQSLTCGEQRGVDLIPLDVEPCVTECSAESGPHAAGIKPLYRARVSTELLLQPPSSGKHSLLIKSVTHFNRSSYVAAHSANGRKRRIKRGVLGQRGGEGYEKRGVRCNLAFAPSAQGKLEVGYFSRADHGVGIL